MKSNLVKKNILHTVLLCVGFNYSFSQVNSSTIIMPDTSRSSMIKYGDSINNSVQKLITCDGNDVRVFPSGNAQSEIHISINKINPQVLLLSSNGTFINNSVQGAYWSTNGGINWAGSDNLPNGAFGRGYPSTAFDAAGKGYISSMNATAINASTANGYLMQRTDNNGATWQPQVHATGLINNFDKEMIAADDIATSPNANNVYSAWSIITSNPSQNLVQFNRSTNQGTTFNTPIILKSGWGQGTNVQTGSNGEVYVCWADYNNSSTDWTSKGLGFCRSTNGGVSFTSAQRVINYTGIRTYNTVTRDDENALFNTIRVNDFPAMAVDKSTGVHRGRIYVAVPVKENGNGKAVIQVSWSDNQGTTWNTLKTISIANGRQTWFPWITVDATNGNIYVIYYSLDGATGFGTNTYVAVSNDGGATFINQLVSDVAHTTSAIAGFGGGYCGDYIGITSHGGKAYAAWYDNRTGQWQDYVSQVSNADITGSDYFCSGSSYSLTNIPTNSTVTWSITPPSGIAKLGCTTCNQTTLTKLANGTVTLTASIANACGNTALQISKPVTVSNPPFPTGVTTATSNYTSYNGPLQSSVSFFMPAGQSGLATFDITDSRYSSFAWSPVSVPTGSSWTTGGPLNQQLNITIQALGSAYFTTTATIKLTAQGPCGIYNMNFGANAVVQGWSGYSIVPNPAQDYVTISTDKSNMKSGSPNLFYGIKITDRLGTVRKVVEYKSGVASVRLPLVGLNSGLYLVSVFDGHNWNSKQLIIQ